MLSSGYGSRRYDDNSEARLGSLKGSPNYSRRFIINILLILDGDRLEESLTGWMVDGVIYATVHGGGTVQVQLLLS